MTPPEEPAVMAVDVDSFREQPPKIAPIESFVAPLGLCGSAGGYRCTDKCRLDVANDIEAIRWWVFQTSQNEVTAASRRTAADKLVNWACFDRNKAVSALDREDFAAFSRFLADPHPIDRWIQAGRVSRESDRWRPFRRALSTAARVQTMRQVASLVRWLGKQSYADLRCPFGTRDMKDGISVSAEMASAFRSVRIEEPLTIAEWNHIRRTMNEFYPCESAALERLIVELLYFGGHSASEIADISRCNVDPPNRVVPCWTLHVWTRSAWRDSVVYAPPPLGDSLARWMRGQGRAGQDHLELLCSPRAPLLGVDAARVQALGNKVLRQAARFALAQSQVELGLRLRERSIVAFRGAFKVHQHRAGSDYATRALTRSLSFKLRCLDGDAALRDVRQLWDWSHAAHLWTDDDSRPSNATS